MTPQPTDSSRLTTPLQGIRVLEMGQVLAGPFAATLLAYFGAEVIKIEPPGAGDPIRQWRLMKGDSSLWWHSLGRNKKCITLDLRKDEGRRLARQLIERVDVLIENFRPGTLERWDLDPDELRRERPELIVARISGYGQTGPNAKRPGYASVCEGFGGLRYVNGFPDRPPARPNLSLGDSLAGLHAAFGIVLALLARIRGQSAGDNRQSVGDNGQSADGIGQGHGTGQVVDVAIYESVFNLLEAMVPEYDGAGAIRERSGSTITGIVPSNTYPCRDGEHVIIGANGTSNYRRLMHTVGREDLAGHPDLQTNPGRVERQEEIDAAISAWTSERSAREALAILERAEVPAGPIHSVADMVDDPHFQARELFEEVEVDGAPLKIPAILPKLGATPGSTHWPGPKVGAHNREILGGWLGLDDAELERLRAAGVV